MTPAQMAALVCAHRESLGGDDTRDPTVPDGTVDDLAHFAAMARRR